MGTAMKKLLLIPAIGLLVGCSTQKDMTIMSKEPIYREQLLTGKISVKDYFFLMDQEKELNEMKGVKR